MSERSYTPRDIFADILEDNEPQAVAWVRGDAAHPALSGMIKFYKTPYQGVLIEAEVFGLPGSGTAVSEQLLWIPYPRKWKLQRYGGKPVR